MGARGYVRRVDGGNFWRKLGRLVGWRGWEVIGLICLVVRRARRRKRKWRGSRPRDVEPSRINVRRRLKRRSTSADDLLNGGVGG